MAALTEIGFDCLALPDYDTARGRIGAGDRFDLLLTDLHLAQDRRGSDLIGPFLSCNPTAVALLVSGRFSPAETCDIPRAACLSKPLDPPKLRAAIEMLQSPS